MFAFGGAVDDLELTVPAATAYRNDNRGLPVSKVGVAGSELDFRQAKRVGSAELDVAFTDLDRDSRGRATVEVGTSQGAGQRAVRLWVDSGFTHLMIFTGDTLSEQDRRRRAVAVEPMTAAPDMLHNHDGMVVLDEGDSLVAEWGIETTSRT